MNGKKAKALRNKYHDGATKRERFAESRHEAAKETHEKYRKLWREYLKARYPEYFQKKTED